jgi:hypothetical protein
VVLELPNKGLLVFHFDPDSPSKNGGPKTRVPRISGNFMIARFEKPIKSRVKIESYVNS